MSAPDGIKFKRHIGPGQLRNLVFQQKQPEIEKLGDLQMGDKIANGLRVFWDNQEASVTASIEEDGWLIFKTPTNFGEYFSISWTIDFDLVRAASPETFVSFMLDDYDLVRDKTINLPFVAGLIIEKGSIKARLSEQSRKIDSRFVVSFTLEHDYELWKQSHNSWVDAIFYGDALSQVSIKNPCLCLQKYAF